VLATICSLTKFILFEIYPSKEAKYVQEFMQKFVHTYGDPKYYDPKGSICITDSRIGQYFKDYGSHHVKSSTQRLQSTAQRERLNQPIIRSHRAPSKDKIRGQVGSRIAKFQRRGKSPTIPKFLIKPCRPPDDISKPQSIITTTEVIMEVEPAAKPTTGTTIKEVLPTNKATRTEKEYLLKPHRQKEIQKFQRDFVMNNYYLYYYIYYYIYYYQLNIKPYECISLI
jgi:hypothetical protein